MVEMVSIWFMMFITCSGTGFVSADASSMTSFKNLKFHEFAGLRIADRYNLTDRWSSA